MSSQQQIAADEREGMTTDDQRTPTDDTPTRIEKDDAFHVLQNARRRAVLRYLFEQDAEEVRMRDVAEAVAAWEHDTTVQQLTSDERQRVYIALYQSHLPKLDKHNLIRYNQPRGNIHVRPLLAGFAPYLADGLHTEGDQLSITDTEEQPESGGVIEAVGSLFTR